MRIRVKSLLATVYYIGTLFLFAFVNFNGATAFYDMTVPFIEGTVVVWHFGFSVLCVVILVFLSLVCRQKVRVDIITICLLFKCLLDAFPMVYSNVEVESYFWHYSCTLSSLMAYFILSNIHMNDRVNRKIKASLQCFGLVLSIQVIFTAVFCGYSYFDIHYKSAMVIPYGGTNIIAAILVPILCIVLLGSSTKMKKLIYFSIFTVAIILTKSRGGILMEFMLITYLAYRKAGKKENKVVKRLLITLFVILLVLAMLSNEDVIYVFSGYLGTSTRKSFLDGLTSGRIGTWMEVLKAFGEGNIIFGNGVQSFIGNISGAHNIVIDLLFKCGLIGFVNYLVAFSFMVKRGQWLFKHNNTAYFVAVVSIYLNSLFEVNYFSYKCDAMLWMIIGAMMSEYYSVRSWMHKESVSIPKRKGMSKDGGVLVHG